jgi:transposase-like protein
MDNTHLEAVARRAGGIAALCRELGVSRQTFYDWRTQGGMTPGFALRAARWFSGDAMALCAERHRDELRSLFILAREVEQ